MKRIAFLEKDLQNSDTVPYNPTYELTERLHAWYKEKGVTLKSSAFGKVLVNPDLVELEYTQDENGDWKEVGNDNIDGVRKIYRTCLTVIYEE